MTDLRIRRTRELIRRAFVSLINEQGFEQLTVQAISERAMINRKTFYAHYVDKYAVADELCTMILDWLHESFQLREKVIANSLTLEIAIKNLQPQLVQLRAQWFSPLQALMRIPKYRKRLTEQITNENLEMIRRRLKLSFSDFEQVILGSVINGAIEYILDGGQLPSSDEIRKLHNDIQMMFG